jgi:hypothetical protein
MTPQPAVSPELRRALDTARDAIRDLDAAGFGIRGLVGMDVHGMPVIAIDPPVNPADIKGFQSRIVRYETRTDVRTLWAGRYAGAIVTWMKITPKPALGELH